MKWKHWAALGAALCFLPDMSYAQDVANRLDSVYIFSYATASDAGRSGLKLAWSRDTERWYSVGDGYGYVKSDYGAWGSEKRMIRPHLMRGTDGKWHCVWQLNEEGKELAHAASAT